MRFPVRLPLPVERADIAALAVQLHEPQVPEVAEMGWGLLRFKSLQAPVDEQSSTDQYRASCEGNMGLQVQMGGTGLYGVPSPKSLHLVAEHLLSLTACRPNVSRPL